MNAGYLFEGKLIIYNQGQKQTWNNKEKVSESVVLLIIWSPNDFVMPHVPHNWERASQEYQLHSGIVKRDKVCE